MSRMNAITNSGSLVTSNGSLRWLALFAEQTESANPDTPPDFLHPLEIEHWQTLRVEKRRKEWILGRRAAKELVAGMLHEKTGQLFDLRQIAVVPHTDGWPVLALPEGASVAAMTLSISHTHEVAFCGAVEGENRLLGVDIEAIETRAAGFAEEYFTPLENQFLAVAPAEQHATLINAIWSGKEAALKAIRRGLAEDTRLVSCLPHPLMGDREGWLPVRIVWDEERSTRPMPLLAGYWRREADLVMTVGFAAEAA